MPNKKSYLYQPILLIFRGVLRSFIHGYLITNYQNQILALFLISVLSCAMCLFFRKLFQSYLIFVLYFCYFGIFVVLDLYFVVESYGGVDGMVSRDVFGFVIVVMIILVSLLTSLTFLC